MGKRALDILCAGSVITLLSPLLALVAILIKLSSPGPVFYRQERIGKGRRPFRIFKFRTMVVGAEKEGAGVLCLENDPRVTRVGRILRTYSLDELPQLFNVLGGSMSLVGPRPGLAWQVSRYSPFQAQRLAVLPGITGWAQVNGRNSIAWEERIRYDVEYLSKVSFLFDLKIMIKTVKTILFRENLFAEKDYFGEKRPFPDRPQATDHDSVRRDGYIRCSAQKG